ncbi:hypothetical protein BaOVIS_011540 [Babesia ovis]|uniref:RAP domain-containing protein n=1 Tax=Babesia ovis TaxID=5869 RepID=A0A9W5TA83_BABOV|nr:hypothetical protein BaOVIS_011540 [Babesia ovis]
MWTLRLGAKPFDSYVFRGVSFSSPSSRQLHQSGFASINPLGSTKVKPSADSFPVNSIDTRLRRVKSLSELRQLCLPTSEFPAGAELAGSGITTVGKLYALRVIDSSGIFCQSLGAILVEDVDFAECVTWHLLSSLQHHTSSWEHSCPRSKLLVGLAWYSAKIATSIGTSLYSSSVDPTAHTGSPPPLGVLISPQSPLNSRADARLALIKRCIDVVNGILCRFKKGLTEPNGKDIQQLLMIPCEGILSKMDLNINYDQGSIDSKTLVQELEDARRAAIRSIEELAHQYAQAMNDSELMSVFVSCCTKDVSDSLVTFLAQCLKDRASVGPLDLCLRDCITLFNTSKVYKLPSEILSAVLSQLSSCCFLTFEESLPCMDDFLPTAQDGTSMQGDHCDSSGDQYQHQIMKTSFSDLGRFCKSVYHIHCNNPLLGSIDRTLYNILSSTSFCQRLALRNRYGPRSMNSGVIAISSIIHLLARNGYRGSQSLEKVMSILPSIPWDETVEDDMILLADLSWSLLTLRVEAWRLGSHFDKLFNHLDRMPLKHCVKLLGGLYNSFGPSSSPRYDLDPPTQERVPMDDLLSYTLNDHCEMVTNSDQDNITMSSAAKELTKDRRSQAIYVYMRSLRLIYMRRFEVNIFVVLLHFLLQEVIDVQNLSNYMFYVTSVLGDLSYGDYVKLCRRWLEISMFPGLIIKVEALSQVLWSLQKNRIYHEPLLTRVCDILHEKLWFCSIGQLALMSHTLLTFNMNTPKMLVSLLTRLEYLMDGSVDNQGDIWVVKLVSVLWSIILSDISRLEAHDIVRTLELLNRVDWPLFMRSCRYQDLRKVLQMQMSIDVELKHILGPIHFQDFTNVIPEYVLYAAIKSTRSVNNTVPLSASQDKARRSLISFGSVFKCEYELYNGITVDFVLSRYNEHNDFRPDLVIEIDGPHHYNVICDDCSSPYIQSGTMRLSPNGKTEFRNRIIRKLGYAIESIPWADAHRRAIHQTIGDILRRHHFPVKQK